jgi:zinc protease
MRKIYLLVFLIVCSLAGFAQKSDRSKPPVLGPAKNLELPAIQKFTLSNGLQVVLMEKHSVPMLQINLIVHTGSLDDPAGKEGLSSFAMDLLDEGAGKYSALELSDEIEFLGASISTYSSDIYSGISATVPAARMDAVLQLMSDIALRPRWEAEELERLRKLRLNYLLQAYDEPNAIASRAFTKYLYGENSLYARAASQASIQTYTREDAMQFHSTHFVAGNATLVVVGAAEKAALMPLLEKHFGGMPAGNVSKASRPAPMQVKGRTVYLVDKPGAAQSVVRIGRVGLSRTDADYYGVEVMNTILGGSFTSRLNSNLREEHGYAYGASSWFSTGIVPGPFTAGASVQTDVTGPAVGEFFNEFAKIRKTMPQDDYLRGKNYAALGYAENFETNRSIAASLVEMIVYGLPDTYFNTYVNNILSVSRKQVEAMAKKYIVPEHMVVVIVGDKEKIEAGVEKLKLGKTQMVSVEDVLGEKPDL